MGDEERQTASNAILVCIAIVVVGGIVMVAIHFSGIFAHAIYWAWIFGALIVMALIATLMFGK